MAKMNPLYPLIALTAFAVAGFALTQECSAQQAPKTLAPGVMRSIRPFVNYSETYQWSSMPDIVGQDSSYDWARDLFVSKEIWCLEFSFKPVRVLPVDFPTDKGVLKRVLVWYMVYSVTNTGKALKNELETPGDTSIRLIVGSDTGKPEVKSFDEKLNNIEGTYKPAEVDYNGLPAENGKTPGTLRFVPQFVLTSAAIMDRLKYKRDADGFFKGQITGTDEAIYYDTFLPIAFAKIAALEDPNQKFLTTISMPNAEIKPGETVWGIATWVDLERQTDDLKMGPVDPRIDRFSVYVSGLTNACRWEDSPEAYNPNAKPLTGRSVFRKVLKLNFYRPGDEFHENNQEFHFGQPGELDYQWIYL